MSQQSKKRIDVSSTGSFFFILYCSSSEAVASKWGCNKNYQWLGHSLLEGGRSCARSSRFPLFNLRLFRIPAFILIERAEQKIFPIFRRLTKGSFSAVDNAHVTYFLSLFVETRPLPLVPIRIFMIQSSWGASHVERDELLVLPLNWSWPSSWVSTPLAISGLLSRRIIRLVGALVVEWHAIYR